MTNRSDLPDARGIIDKRRALEALGSEVQQNSTYAKVRNPDRQLSGSA